MMNHNPNWLYIPDYPYRTLITGSLESGKTNALLNLTENQRPDIDETSLYIKYLFESKYPLLITKR